MTYKDGSVFDSGKFMTTTDSLQAAWLYCHDRNDYVEKETMNCNTADKFGFMRPVFVDRVCDNVKDCFGGEDESQDINSALAQCIPEAELASGCCQTYIADGETFAQAGQISNIDAYMSTTDTNSWIIRLNVGSGNTWFLTRTGLPNAQGQFSYYAVSSTRETACPPGDGSFTTGQGFEVNVQCKFSHAVFNTANECTDNTHTCHADATCGDTVTGFTCHCNNGFTGDGFGCTEIILVDECSTGGNNCHADATCTDTELSFTCACNADMTDISADGDGTNCVAVPPCCTSFTIGIENPTALGETLSK